MHTSNYLEGARKDAWTDQNNWNAVLGDGGFGIVFKNNENNVAIKCIPMVGPYEGSTKEILTTTREYRNMKDKVHHNLVTILDAKAREWNSSNVSDLYIRFGDQVGERTRFLLAGLCRLPSVNTLLIKMELCGETLRSWLKIQSPEVPEDNATLSLQKEMVYNLLCGMKYLHSCHIIHRDIRPENILFTEIGFKMPIKLADFGLSRRHSRESQTNFSWSSEGSLTKGVGHHAYMAPEVTTGDYDTTADYYSVGITIWEVLYLGSPTDRNQMVHQLVQCEEDVVLRHPSCAMGKLLVEAMTKRLKGTRKQEVDKILPFVLPTERGSVIEVNTFEHLGFWQDFGPRRRCLKICLGSPWIQLEIVGNNVDYDFLDGTESFQRIRVSGNCCRISSLKFCEVSVTGKFNNVEKLVMSPTNDMAKVDLLGVGNILQVVVPLMAIELLVNVKVNVTVAGTGNVLRHVLMTKASDTVFDCGNIELTDGYIGKPDISIVDHLSEEIFHTSESPKGLNYVLNGHVGSAKVEGSNHIISGVHFPGIVECSGNNIRFIRCSSMLLVLRLDATVICDSCKFNFIIRSNAEPHIINKLWKDHLSQYQRYTTRNPEEIEASLRQDQISAVTEIKVLLLGAEDSGKQKLLNEIRQLPDYYVQHTGTEFEELNGCKTETSGIVEHRFSYKNSHFKMCEVKWFGTRGEKISWFHRFSDVMAMLFFVALDSYDKWDDGETEEWWFPPVNRMRETINQFRSLCNCTSFLKTPVILFLSYDVDFQKKCSPLKDCFPEYAGSTELRDVASYLQAQFEKTNTSEAREIYSNINCNAETVYLEICFDDLMSIILTAKFRDCGLL